MFLSSADFFSKSTFLKKFFQEYHQCQTVWSQIWPNILLGLIWVQTVCKGYEQTTLVSKKFSCSAHVQFSSKVLGLNHLLTIIVCASSKLFA